MGATVYVGLAVTSHNVGTAATATFTGAAVVTTTGAPAPSITSLTPTSGAVGTAVTIAGANFGATQGTSTVTFNGTAATPTSWSGTSIVAPVPSGATSGNVVVRVGGVASNGASFTVTGAAGLPSPWLATDIGSPAVAGSATFASGTFTVTGAGADVWGTADQFQFAYRTLTGDGEILAQVASLQNNTSTWAKAGVMMRETLTAGARNAFVAVTLANGLTFQRRVATDGTSVATAGGAGAAPYWVRLVRSGATFSAYRSTTGSTWTLIGSETIGMGATVYVGLAVTSHNVGTAATATFTGVSP
jgi:hypothetical protein